MRKILAHPAKPPCENPLTTLENQNSSCTKTPQKSLPHPKTRSYGVDSRHLLPMLRDLFELATLRLANKQNPPSRHPAWPQRPPARLRRPRYAPRHRSPRPRRLPRLHRAPRDHPPAHRHHQPLRPRLRRPLHPPRHHRQRLAPKKIFETGTFRGVGTLTMALNAPEADIYTLDLPEQYTDAEVETLSKGDKEWVRLSRTSTGFAFLGHPAAARIHQLRGNSLTFTPPPPWSTPTSASSTAATPTSASRPTPKPP